MYIRVIILLAISILPTAMSRGRCSNIVHFWSKQSSTPVLNNTPEAQPSTSSTRDDGHSSTTENNDHNPVSSVDTRVTNEGYLQQTDTADDEQSHDGGSLKNRRRLSNANQAGTQRAPQPVQHSSQQRKKTTKF